MGKKKTISILPWIQAAHHHHTHHRSPPMSIRKIFDVHWRHLWGWRSWGILYILDIYIYIIHVNMFTIVIYIHCFCYIFVVSMHSTFATKALQLKTILKPKQQTWETFWKGWVNSQLCTPISVWNHGHLYSELLEGQVSLPHYHPVKNCDHSNVSRTTSGEYVFASPKNKQTKRFTSWWFQPNFNNMIITLDHFPTEMGWKIENIGNNHLVLQAASEASWFHRSQLGLRNGAWWGDTWKRLQGTMINAWIHSLRIGCTKPSCFFTSSFFSVHCSSKILVSALVASFLRFRIRFSESLGAKWAKTQQLCRSKFCWTRRNIPRQVL